MNKAQTLSILAEKTGLDRATVKDLMKKGWFFDMQADTGRMSFFSPYPKARRN